MNGFGIFPLLYSRCYYVSIAESGTNSKKVQYFIAIKSKHIALLLVLLQYISSIVVVSTCISVHYFWLRFTEGTFCTITHVSYDCPFVFCTILSQIWA